MVTRQKPIKKD